MFTKRILMFCLAFTLLSFSVIVTSIYTYPENAQAYATTQYNYSYNSIDYLPNGYRVGTIGVGTRQITGTYMLIGANISVQVTQNKKTNSKLKSYKIIQTGSGYALSSLNIFNAIKFVSIDNQTTCTSLDTPSYCTLQSTKNINGIIFTSSTSLAIELVFTDGTYTIYPSGSETIQSR